MNFRSKEWKRYGNHFNLVGTTVDVYFWNTGKNQNYLVTAFNPLASRLDRVNKSFGKGKREEAIKFAFSIRERYMYK